MAQFKKALTDAVATINGLMALEEPFRCAVKVVLDCLLAGNKLLVCGNGGSASDATHLATEFLCRFQGDRRSYPAISLTTNGELITAISNDYSFEEVFARQVQGLAQKGDVLIAFTTSGKSENVSRALEEAGKTHGHPERLLSRPWTEVLYQRPGYRRSACARPQYRAHPGSPKTALPHPLRNCGRKTAQEMKNEEGVLPSALKVVRFLSRFPFNVATHARLLIFWNFFAGQDRVQCRSQILSRNRQRITRTAVIQLTAINQTMLGIEQEKIRRARGAIRFGHGLRLVV